MVAAAKSQPSERATSNQIEIFQDRGALANQLSDT